VYIVSNQHNGTLYTGVTSRLIHRACEHRDSGKGKFSAAYGCNFLVWYELHERMESALLREKQIKGGSRMDKLKLIEAMNPMWRDLLPDIIGR